MIMLWCINKYGCLIDDNNLKDMLETDASSSSKKHTFSSQINTLPDVSVHTEHTEVLFIQTAVMIYKTDLSVKRFISWQEVKIWDAI